MLYFSLAFVFHFFLFSLSLSSPLKIEINKTSLKTLEGNFFSSRLTPKELAFVEQNMFSMIASNLSLHFFSSTKSENFALENNEISEVLKTLPSYMYQISGPLAQLPLNHSPGIKTFSAFKIRRETCLIQVEVLGAIGKIVFFEIIESPENYSTEFIEKMIQEFSFLPTNDFLLKGTLEIVFFSEDF